MRGRSLEQPQIASVLQATPGAACAEARTATNEATMTAKTEQQVPESILHPVLLPLHFQSASEIGVTSSRDTGARTDLDAALALPRLAASLRQGKRGAESSPRAWCNSSARSLAAQAAVSSRASSLSLCSLLS